jgi:hypothetical protein
VNTKPSVKEMTALWNKCLEFVESQRISCAETIHQTDRVIENAYEFIEDVCDIVGYNGEDEEE